MSEHEQLPGGSPSLLISLRQRLEAKHALLANAQQQPEDEAGRDEQQRESAGQDEEEQEHQSKHTLQALCTETHTVLRRTCCFTCTRAALPSPSLHLHLLMLLLAGLDALDEEMLQQQDEMQLLDLVSFDHCKEVRATTGALESHETLVRAAAVSAVER